MKKMMLIGLACCLLLTVTFAVTGCGQKPAEPPKAEGKAAPAVPPIKADPHMMPPPAMPKAAPPMPAAPPAPPAMAPAAPPQPVAPPDMPAAAPVAPAPVTPAPAAPEAAPENPKLATPADPSIAEAGAADNAALSVTTDSGTTTVLVGEDARIPEDFPKDVPLYNNMKLETVTKNGQEGIYSLAGITPDSYDQVAKSFKEGAKANQWMEEMSLDQGGQMYMLTYSKDIRTLSIMVMKDEEHSSIQLTVSKSEE